MYKIFAAIAFLAVANAGPASHGATSFASFNDNHNSVQHIESAQFLGKNNIPSASTYGVPISTKPVVVKVAVPISPVYHSAPTAPVYHSTPSASVYHSAPSARIAVSAPVYRSAPVLKYEEPSVKYSAAPVAKTAISEAKYASVPAYKPHHQEEYGPAQYQFAYVVEDSNTGDYHSQEEKREGDHVVGQYSLHEADGTVRIVKYFDDGHGFNAVVEKQGTPTQAPAFKKVVAVGAPEHY